MGQPFPLAEAFCRALPAALAERFAQGRALEAALAGVVARGQAAWPAVAVDAPALAAHLAGRLTADSALEAVHAEDLHLAFACAQGVEAAVRAFDAGFLTAAQVVPGRLPDGLTADEVLQRLRVKLLVRAGEAAPAIAGYSGRGPLAHWVRAAAARLAQDVARAARPEAADSDDALLHTAAGGNLELDYLKGRYGPLLRAAFQEALGELGPREQTLLRMQYLDGASPEDIGRLFGTHRTTVWRWLTQCREQLLARTRELLAARLPEGAGDVSSLMQAVHSQLDVSLHRLLGKE